MLTGKVPFDVATPADVSTEHAKGQLPRPSEANPEISAALDAIVMRLLATNPENRRSRVELVEELGRARDGLFPVVPSPNEASTLASGDPLAPSGRSSASGSSDGTGRGRSFWTLSAFAVLIAVLGLVGWGLLRDPGGSGVPGAAAGTPARKVVEVPAVKGLSAREARRRLDKSGFRASVRSRESPEEDTGKVLEQSVAGGKEVKRNQKIVLTVGKGPRVTKVPDLVGLTYQEAENELEQVGLLLGGVKEAASETVPAGVIVRQDPRAGTMLAPDSYVYLTTSVGPPEETTYGYLGR